MARRKLEIRVAEEHSIPHIMVAEARSEEVLALFFIKPELGMSIDLAQNLATTTLGRLKRSKV